MTNFKGRRPTNPIDGQEESLLDILFKEHYQIGRDYDGDSGMSEEVAREIAKSILMGSHPDLFKEEPEEHTTRFTSSKQDTSNELKDAVSGIPFSVREEKDEQSRRIDLSKLKDKGYIKQTPTSQLSPIINDSIDTSQKKEAVNHPEHYNKGILETMEKFILFFHDNPDMIKGALLFNVLKYTDRAEHKGKKEEDEKKAMFYLDVFETLFEEEAQLYNLYRIFKGKE